MSKNWNFAALVALCALAGCADPAPRRAPVVVDQVTPETLPPMHVEDGWLRFDRSAKDGTK